VTSSGIELDTFQLAAYASTNYATGCPSVYTLYEKFNLNLAMYLIIINVD
jgi:hypothetical protein